MSRQYAAWAVVASNEKIMLWSVRDRRRYAIGAFMDGIGGPRDQRPDWRQHYRNGWRVKRVTIKTST